MKHLILIVFLFLLNSCGYTSVYKNMNNKDLYITITNLKGDRDMNNLIKKELQIFSNENSINKYNIAIDTDYKKVILIKNSAGVATNYQLKAKSTFTVSTDNESLEITLNEKINIKNQNDNFEQNLYEKNIKRNFASSFREKLISKILAQQ